MEAWKIKYTNQKAYSDKSDSMANAMNTLFAGKIMADRKYLKKITLQRNLAFVVVWVVLTIAILK